MQETTKSRRRPNSKAGTTNSEITTISTTTHLGYNKIEIAVVDTPKKTYWKDLDNFLVPLDVPLDQALVPYSKDPLLSADRLWQENHAQLRRESSARLVYRGESRFTPEQILDAGGMHPNSVFTKLTNSKEDIEDWKRRGMWMLDVDTHRRDSNGSGLLSTTTSEDVAHDFTDATSSTFSPHIYLKGQILY